MTSDKAGEALGIAGGALRSIETDRRPASLALAYRAARLYGCNVIELLADSDVGLPREPPEQPDDEETQTGPGPASAVA